MTAPHPWEALYPPGLRWDALLRMETLPALLDRAAASYGEAPAIRFRGSRLTFAELRSRVDRLARGLAALGLRRGETVGLLVGNAPAHPVALFAVLRLGAVVVHLSPLDPPLAVRAKLAEAGARFLIAADRPGVLPQALAAGAAILVLDRDAEWGPGDDGAPAPSPAPAPDGIPDLHALDGPPLDWPRCGLDETALLQFTGGTTGAPRAVRLTHRNLSAAVSIYDRWNEGIGRPFRPDDVVLCVLPLFHIYALTAVLLRALSNGVELLLRPRFHPAAVLDDIERERVTQFNGVPTMWIAIANEPGLSARNLSSLRIASSGGAALPPEVADRFLALTGLRLGGGWGMTETAPAGTNLLPGLPPLPGEIGVPLPGVELGIVAVEEPGRPLPAGTVGELRVRGPNVTPGYWREDASSFADGWFLTGDLGRMEPDGRFVLVDRKKDMLISGGFNVYPRAIEDALHAHPDVLEAAVIGVPDPYRGQAAKAFVVLRPGASMALDALRPFLAERLGRHELPAALEIRDSLPRTAVGKLSKKELS